MEKKVQTKDEVLAEMMAEHIALKREAWGTLTGIWMPEVMLQRAKDKYPEAKPRIISDDGPQFIAPRL